MRISAEVLSMVHMPSLPMMIIIAVFIGLMIGKMRGGRF